MRLDCGAVDRDLLGRPVRGSKRMKEVDPHAFRRPADEPIVERRAIEVGRVDPATAGFDNMNDASRRRCCRPSPGS